MPFDRAFCECLLNKEKGADFSAPFSFKERSINFAQESADVAPCSFAKKARDEMERAIPGAGLFGEKKLHLRFHLHFTGVAAAAGLSLYGGMAEPDEFHDVFITPSFNLCKHVLLGAGNNGKAKSAQHKKSLFRGIFRIQETDAVVKNKRSKGGDGL